MTSGDAKDPAMGGDVSPALSSVDTNERYTAEASHQKGRVVKLDRGFPLIRLGSGQEVRGKHATALVKNKQHRCVIGDEVVVQLPPGHDTAIIEEILPRRTKFVRKDPTERALPQTLAANFDTVIIAQPLEEVNIRRLERELVLAHETGAQVAVVLTKADKLAGEDEVRAITSRIQGLVGGDAVFALSGDDPATLEPLAQFLAETPGEPGELESPEALEEPGRLEEPEDPEGRSGSKGRTAILIGRSGVGKSTLVNLLLGSEKQLTAEVRSTDGKGRHTTVSREIIELPSGGTVVDMPGVRGLGLWDADAGIGNAFSDIEELAQECKFRDCTHRNEPGCAVRAAHEAGEISADRLASYLRLKEESAAVKQRREEAERIRSRRGHPRRRK